MSVDYECTCGIDDCSCEYEQIMWNTVCYLAELVTLEEFGDVNTTD